MHGLAKLALLLPSLANAMPQYPGVVICDSTEVGPLYYENKGNKDVTEQYGDKGWENYDANICESSSEACALTAGIDTTKEISVTFGASGSFDLPGAVNAGLDFGVSVAYSTTKAQSTQESCPSTADEKPCTCGLQYKAYRQEAWGIEHSSNACGTKITKDFDVTAPVLRGNKPYVEWRACRSSKSTCSETEETKMPLCADGI